MLGISDFSTDFPLEKSFSSKRVTRFERATSTLARLHSTTELYPQIQTIIRIADLLSFCQACFAGCFTNNPPLILQTLQDITKFTGYYRLYRTKLSLMDVIRLKGIRSYGYTGALAEEQVLGQWFEVQVVLWLDLSTAGSSDRLMDTLDYGQVVMMVQQLVKTSKFALVERLATAIADTILDQNSPSGISIQQVQVCLTKLAAPIPDFSGEVTVEITRSRLSSQASD